MELRIWQIKGSSFFFILGRIIVIQLDEKKQQLWTISLWILSHERLYIDNEIILLSSVSDDHFVFFVRVSQEICVLSLLNWRQK